MKSDCVSSPASNSMAPANESNPPENKQTLDGPTLVGTSCLLRLRFRAGGTKIGVSSSRNDTRHTSPDRKLRALLRPPATRFHTLTLETGNATSNSLVQLSGAELLGTALSIT